MKRVIGVSAILVLASQAMAWPEKSPDSAKQTTVSLQSAAALARAVDKAVAAKCQESGIALSPQTTDAEFLRRVHLDLVGHIPTLERTRSFLASTEPDKRAKLVDELLASSDYGQHMADIWQALLLSKNSVARRLDTEVFVDWLAESFNKNQSWDNLVREIITAKGAQDKNPATTFWLSQVSVDNMTDTVCKVFLGVQLQCAQCHNHPFTGWKQDEYWGLAAFFLNVKAAPPGNKQTTSPVVSEGKFVRKKNNPLPESAKVGSSSEIRPVLADWLCAETNPYLARSMVNRLWAQMFSRGLVHPIDNIHDGNPASHPELLEDLTRRFKDGKYDVKAFLRGLCLSETYQRSSKPVEGNKDAVVDSYARMPMKVLTPEQLYDSLLLVLGSPERGAKARKADTTPVKGAKGPRAQFVAFFSGEEGADATEYQVGIPQALQLMNATRTNAPGIAVKLTGGATDPAKALESLYLATLNRKPTSSELAMARDHSKKASNARQAASDVLWALINSSEFTTNH
jgi:hypothetical protein